MGLGVVGFEFEVGEGGREVWIGVDLLFEE